MDASDPPDPPDPNMDLLPAVPITLADRSEGGSPVPPPPPKGSVHSGSLCALLASTAVRLCPGRPSPRMAFAPVAPDPHSDSRVPAILERIIARVVERKIQERDGGTAGPCAPPPGTPPTHQLLAPGGQLWLHDPPHANSYGLFRQHWRQGQLDPALGGPGWLFPRGGGQQELEVTELRGHRRKRVGSSEFWDGFGTSAAQPGPSELLKLECSIGDTQQRRVALPFPEYCDPHGQLNLVSHLQTWPGWMRPRVCAAYGE
ncbi:lysine-specific demethylase hairless-like [Coturnix japonica]|uniref:lysine-specific demethylase hairless-like n=1 Tax=Coturnix japonica TaxID=93934 RepID=UPI0013A5EBD1|nr:lysine-specific demethylase hairless-like [Coturnix japonica]